MKPIAVYHWWKEPEEDLPINNIRVPVLLSIATLRAVSDMPIVVLQAENEKSWGYFPDKLNFKVENFDFHLRKYSNKIKGFRHLSRIYDLNQWASVNAPDSDIMYVDSDVFFFKDPLPLACKTDRFCWNGWNTGFFYYNQASPTFSSFFDAFDAYVRSAVYSPVMLQLLKGYVNYEEWYGIWDEMILGYMKYQHPKMFNTLPDEEHITAKTIYLIELGKDKVFHGNGSIASNPFTKYQYAIGLLCLVIEEFYEKICKVLSQEDILNIFGKDLLEWSKDKRFSILKNASSIKIYKNLIGHYDITLFATNNKKMRFI